MTVAALDFGGSTVKAALVDSSGSLLDLWAHPAPADAAALEPIAGRLRAWAGARLTRVGMAVAGSVNPAGTGLASVHGKSEALRGLDLKRWAAELTGLPPSSCLVENDARAALAGELAPGGAAAGAQSAVMLAVGTGIGSAISLGGRLVHGTNGFGGILGGHITVRLDGRPCQCGNVGCAEAFAGTWALPGRAASHPGFAESPLAAMTAFGFRELLEAEAAGDACAHWLAEDCIRVWAAAVGSLCHLVDPEVVVLSGAPFRAAERILPTLQRLVRENLWDGMPRPPIRAATDPAFGAVRGVGLLARQPPRRAGVAL